VGMWAAALRHAEMVGELTALQSAVSSVVEEVLGRLPNETFRVEVMDELVAKFQRQEELCLRLVGLGARICDLLNALTSSEPVKPNALTIWARPLDGLRQYSL
jgi:hypothetical protein